MQEIQNFEKLIQETQHHPTWKATDKLARLEPLYQSLIERLLYLNAPDVAATHWKQFLTWAQDHLPETLQTHAEWSIYLANLYVKSNLWAKAMAIYEELDTQLPENQQGVIFYLKGNVALLQQDYEVAEKYYREALVLYEKYQQENEMGVLYRNLALLYYYQKDNKNALLEFEKSIEILFETHQYSELSGTFFNLRVFLAEAMSLSNRNIYYQQKIQEAETRQKNTVGAFWYYQWTLQQQQEKPQEVLAYWENALQKFLKSNVLYEVGNVYYYLGHWYDLDGQTRKALERYIKALQYMLKYENYENIGMVTYYLEIAYEDSHNPVLQKEIDDLIAQVRAKGLYNTTDGETDENTPPPNTQELLQNLIEQTHEQEYTTLLTAYQQLKPNAWAEISVAFLEKTHQLLTILGEQKKYKLWKTPKIKKAEALFYQILEDLNALFGDNEVQEEMMLWWEKIKQI
ncbi:MAG: tetratricopeptide repeat protein [Cytophagales bacterium]|nr:MAG: tetratricopeptide repeat protein [Cytophagales bacterium]